MGALTLGRKTGQRIFLEHDGRTTVITLRSIQGGKAKLLIEADDEVLIMREELLTEAS